jgi:predicted dehydrogenase
MRKVKWGVIGIGGIAQRRTVPDMLKTAQKAELTAVMDINKDLAKNLAEKFGVKSWYTKEEDLLTDNEVEAVYIATPNYLHHKHVIMSAGEKKHILCEKPLGLNMKECEEMIQECGKNGVILGIGFMMRFHAIHRKIRELIQDGAIGKPVLGRAQLTCWYPRMEGNWRQIPEQGGGGSLVDMGSHCIDLLEMLFSSKVKEVMAFQDTLIQDYKVEDTSTVLLRFQNGSIGIVDNCFNIPDKASLNRLEVYGSGGSILTEGSIGQEPFGKMFTYVAPQRGYEALQERAEAQEVEGKEVKVEPVRIYAAEIDHISECILDGKTPEINGELGLWSVKVVSACYESANAGRTVTVT